MGLASVPATVITVSDGVASGSREDLSGAAIEQALSDMGFDVTRRVVADEIVAIVEILRTAVLSSRLVVTTGGTGFGPRDVTPEATLQILDREAPGLAQLMISQGLESTKMAALSRLRTGSRGSSLILNLPGSPKGALESLNAVLDLIPHALDLLAGDTGHPTGITDVE